MTFLSLYSHISLFNHIFSLSERHDGTTCRSKRQNRIKRQDRIIQKDIVGLSVQDGTVRSITWDKDKRDKSGTKAEEQMSSVAGSIWNPA